MFFTTLNLRKEKNCIVAFIRCCVGMQNSGFVLMFFAPDNETQGDWEPVGGIVATKDGFSFEKVYKDSFSEGTFYTAENGWSCDIAD